VHVNHERTDEVILSQFCVYSVYCVTQFLSKDAFGSVCFNWLVSFYS